MNMTELDGVFILNTFIKNYNIRILYIKQDRYIGINKPFSNLFNRRVCTVFIPYQILETFQYWY